MGEGALDLRRRLGATRRCLVGLRLGKIGGVGDEGLRRWYDYERARGCIRAQLRLLSTAEGGRRTAIRTGYHSQWGFEPDVHAGRHDAPLLIEEAEMLGLGEEAVVRLHPLWPEGWPDVRPGLHLTMYEGPRVVGIAEVVEVVTPEA